MSPRLFALVLALPTLAGCIPTGENRAGGGGGAASVSGKAVFDANGCAQCHTLNGQGGRGGPDLTRAGSNPAHNAAWIIAHVKDPKGHNPGSRMPSYQGKINDTDLAALGAYLAGLK